ncbi:Helicase associated domain protein [uncultured Oscillibacter sp.]|uniref:Helicase associated domain protein n=1 Tax=uncultured Oscillibacter sp. TaxID=876091 RepID=UPI0025E498C9|nr:Helicase associated domain protein [uncultured Oscillibacter sp.]
MAIELFPHNEAAYRSAAAMLAETGSAAVVHPTGTGKSFIAFKFCEDHPEQSVCWLSPSEHIFRTQKENLLASGGDVPGNIRFFTYAKLMMMRDEELAEIRPDCIVLDEFHRCGAEQWGQGVGRLRAAYPKAAVLGLSATNVRYLDNQRDMAGELFDGNIASEMTLGESITRGILDPPRYVLTAFSLESDLKKYEARIGRTKSAVTRDKAEKLLEALRRALEQAEGLDVVFERHMRERDGRYIVFCAGVKHMEEMIARVPEWFGGIDAAPHVYRAYSDDPETGRAFQAFKEDGSGHLKLLFCIDMLNEGIHVENVSGVILFRPTVSPIVYKQQIGRALSAGGSKEAVIFDVVNNIENLYSIGTVEAEMRAAAECFRFYGEEERIVNERFRVIDEVRDCRRLFDELEDTLTASWDLMYRLAKQFYEEHGHLRVPRRYKTEEGYALGNWIGTQRSVRAGRQYGRLPPERIARLDAIGMVWEDPYTAAWNRCYAALVRYRQEHGDLDVPADYVTADGLRLGGFVSSLRRSRALGERSVYLSGERIGQLDGLGMIWDKLDLLWERNYAACLEYYREHGDLEVPSGHIAPNGLKIGAWLRRMRQIREGGKGRLTQEQIRRLDAIGMVWEDAYARRWGYGYRQARKWWEAHHDLEVPAAYVDEDGFALGKWVRRHREVDLKTGRRAIRLTAERKAKLDGLGMRWEKEDPWETRYRLAEAYYREHGDLEVPAGWVTEGIWLNKWLNEQKQIYRGKRPGKTLTAQQIARLEEIGMVWNGRAGRTAGSRARG